MKLIDWSKMPRGTLVRGTVSWLNGEIISHLLDGQAVVLYDTKNATDLDRLDYAAYSNLRLIESPVWIAHDGGPCPLPEGLIVEVRYAHINVENYFVVLDAEQLTTTKWLSLSDYENGAGCSEFFAYRIIGVDRAGGWTDDHSEVTK